MLYTLKLNKKYSPMKASCCTFKCLSSFFLWKNCRQFFRGGIWETTQGELRDPSQLWSDHPDQYWLWSDRFVLRTGVSDWLELHTGGAKPTWVAHWGCQTDLSCAQGCQTNFGCVLGVPRLTLLTVQITVVNAVMYCFRKNRRHFKYLVFGFFSNN